MPPRAAARPADAGAARVGTTTAQLLAMVDRLRLWRVQRAVMESAKQDGIPDTKSAVTPDLGRVVPVIDDPGAERDRARPEAQRRPR